MTCAMACPALCGLHYCHSGKKPANQIETLVPDFRGRMDRALDILTQRHQMCSTITWKTYRVFTVSTAWCRLQLVAEAAGTL